MRRIVFFTAISLALFAFLPGFAGADSGGAPEPDAAPEGFEPPDAGPDTAFRGEVFPRGAPIPPQKFISAKDSRGREIPLVQTRRFTPGEDSVEIEDRGNRRKIRFAKISPRALGASLGFEEVQSRAIRLDGAETVGAYAVDPSQFQFQSAAITAVATGHFLYKCKDWNFYAQQCPPGGWKKIMDLVPGAEYSVPLGPTDPAYSEADPLQNFNATDYYLASGTVSAGTLGNTNTSDGATFGILEAPAGYSKNATIEVQLAASATVPRHTVWDGDAFSWSGLSNDTAPGGGGTPRLLVMRANPKRDERILGTLDSSLDIYVQVWNGTGFGPNTQMTAAAQAATRENFDIQYEQLSGDAVVVFANSTAYQVQYRTWNGTAWGAITPLVAGWPAAANARVALYPHNGSDEMMLLVETANATTPSLFAAYWDGASFGAPALLASNLSSVNTLLTGKSFDGAWEPAGGEFVVFYTVNTATNIAYRNYSSGAWAPQALGFSGANGAARSVIASAYPGTENVMACWLEHTAADLDCQMWNGTQVGTGKEQDTAVEVYATTRNFDVAPVLGTGGFAVMYGDQNDDWFDFYLCNSAANCFAGTFTTAANTPIALWSATQLGGVDTSWGAMEADPGNPGNLTLIGLSQTAANGWYRNQIYCNSTSCYSQGNWVSLGGGTTAVAYKGCALAFDAHGFYRAEAWHNSTETSGIPQSAQIYSVNATAKFNSTHNTSYALGMYNWTSSLWEQCASGAVVENEWNTWSCNYSSGMENLRAPGGGGQIRIMLNETSAHPVQSELLEDYLKFFVTWDAPAYYGGGAGGAGVNQSGPQPGEWVEFFALWNDDTALSNHTLEWNGTGAMQNQSWSGFAAANASWANWSVQIPAGMEGKIIYGKIWANDSRNFLNSTPFYAATVQNVSPAVSATYANESDVLSDSPICINASATDAGVGADYVWAMVSFPNGTSYNYTMSDTGCNAGGAGDGSWGVQISTGATPGNVTINTTYANDTIGNLGWQSPLAQLNVSSSNPPQYNTTLGYLGANASGPLPGDNVTFFSHWSDDSGLKQYALEWNATGVFENQTWLDFPSSNNSWANYSIEIPLSAENKTIWWRMWATGSSSSTPFQQTESGGNPPIVNGTYVNATAVPVDALVCVNASAGDAGSGIDSVWTMLAYPNGTSANLSLSDTGCNAGGTGDNSWGAWLNVSHPGGNVTINTTYANDTVGNMASESPFPNLQLYLTNAIGGSDYYVGFYGQVSTKIKPSPASPNSLYNRRSASGSVFITPAGAAPSWLNLKAATLGADMPAMDAALGLSASKDLLANNYASGQQAMCGVNSVNYMQSSDGNWKIGALYSDESAPGGYSGGDIIIFCTQINYNAPDAFGTTSDYEFSFPKTFSGNIDLWHDLD
ncbi:MAG: hypothetical protein WC792_00035 [Candidatus Micrarchaeia archaeon]